MSSWVVAVGLLAVGAWCTRQEPRRLGNGVLLLAGLSGLVLAAFDLVARLDDDPGHRASALVLLALLGLTVAFALVLAGFGIYHGIVMLRRERRSLANLLSLLAGLVVLVYVVLGVGSVLGERLLLVVLMLLSLLPVGYLGFVFTAFVGYSWLYGVWVGRRGQPPAAVVVLGAGLIGDRVPPLLAGRLRRGAEVHARGRAAGVDSVLVASGGQGPDELVPEARAMADWLVAHDLPAEQVLVEDRSPTSRSDRGTICGSPVIWCLRPGLVAG